MNIIISSRDEDQESMETRLLGLEFMGRGRAGDWCGCFEEARVRLAAEVVLVVTLLQNH